MQFLVFNQLIASFFFKLRLINTKLDGSQFIITKRTVCYKYKENTKNILNTQHMKGAIVMTKAIFQVGPFECAGCAQKS